MILRLLLIIVFSPFLLLGRLLGFGRSNMAYLPEGHPEMAKAVEQARSSLDEFRRLMAAPEPGMENFSIKARFPVPEGGSEHIWVGHLEPQDTGFLGKLDNHPQHLRDVKLGSTVFISEDMISDWGYAKDGVYHGHFTTKVLLPRMDKTMRKKVETVYGWTGAQPA